MPFSIHFGRDYLTFDSFTVLSLAFLFSQQIIFKFEKKLAIPGVFTKKKKERRSENICFQNSVNFILLENLAHFILFLTIQIILGRANSEFFPNTKITKPLVARYKRMSKGINNSISIIRQISARNNKNPRHNSVPFNCPTCIVRLVN